MSTAYDHYAVNFSFFYGERPPSRGENLKGINPVET
jgi:hypothetical protein